ncbi:hypothetical protein Taro_025219 [Colocasia esculenta]|uniref:Aminotransferase-like plant mobile domain-containing protein n=1 Tax=Colocasia esculenta TaxID=4460 RepID=A0A843VGX9_COLES|nr:hypothetical protein [Colocasia esculenta]
MKLEPLPTLLVDIGLRIEVLHCNLHLVAGKVVVHVADAFICIWIQIKKGHLIIIVVIVANQDIIEVHVQGYNPIITIRNSVPLMYLPLLEDLDRATRYSWGGATLSYLYRQLSIACKSDAKAICGSLTLLQIWHRRTDYIIPPDEETVDIGRVEYMVWYWSITRRYIGRPGFTYDMRYEPRDHIERSLVEDVMTVSQYGLYDVGASQILTDEGMTDTQPSQSTVGTYRRQRRHRGSTSTLPQQSQSDLLGETLGSIDEDMDSETAQSESCDAILVHETQSQSETET